jgi:hypothetical protein
MKKTSAYWKVALALTSALFFSSSYGQGSMWICAGQKADIPSGYFVYEIATDLNTCAYPKQNMLVSKISASDFWMCDFANIGTPPGYVVTQESKVQTCGCKVPAKDVHGKVYCSGNEPEGKKGWPKILVHKVAK